MLADLRRIKRGDEEVLKFILMLLVGVVLYQFSPGACLVWAIVIILGTLTLWWKTGYWLFSKRDLPPEDNSWYD